MRIQQLSVVAFSIAAALGAAACRKSPPATAAQPTAVPNQDSIRLARARADSIARAEADQRARLARESARADSVRRAAALRDSAAARSALAAAVHFDFNVAELRAAERALLDRKAEIMQRIPVVRIRAEGNADDRGSDEYNFALGMRRADVVKAYLVQRGVDPSRIEIVSYGEERRVCSGEGESCWSQNRRAEFVIVAGGERIQGAG